MIKLRKLRVGLDMDNQKALLATLQSKHDGVWVIMGRLIKSAHFLPVTVKYSLNKLAKSFIDEIVRLYGVPFSTTFHPQTDGQSERTIQTLEGMLRACTLQFRGEWDEKLPLMEPQPAPAPAAAVSPEFGEEAAGVARSSQPPISLLRPPFPSSQATGARQTRMSDLQEV
ncbi:hypothetical protein L3X38_023748 [Prunus dulcis]|uniref:Uncharacterized protein n=1 Tax=Prunus dulcis TaxID=3755 RepID=A0AAD4W112_PRUDU|nr:hypothetical protein L3X38_023748 [Prunus dulcis]